MLTKREFTKNLRKDVKETIDGLNDVVDFLNQVDTALGYPFKDEISDENLNKMMNIIGMLKKSVHDTYNKLDSIAVEYLDYKSGLKESRLRRGQMLKEGIRSSERETAQKRSEADVIAKKRARELLDVLKDLKNYGYDFCLDKGRDEQALKEMNPEFGLRIRISEYDINTKTMDLCNKLSNEFRTWVYIQDWTYSKSWELTFVYECFTDGYQFNDIMKYLD